MINSCDLHKDAIVAFEGYGCPWCDDVELIKEMEKEDEEKQDD